MKTRQRRVQVETKKKRSLPSLLETEDDNSHQNNNKRSSKDDMNVSILQDLIESDDDDENDELLNMTKQFLSQGSSAAGSATSSPQHVLPSTQSSDDDDHNKGSKHASVGNQNTNDNHHNATTDQQDWELAQKRARYAQVTQVDDIDNVNLLKWHKVKSRYYPCCIRQNQDEALLLVQLTAHNDTLIRYIGYLDKDANTLAAVPGKSLVPYDYSHGDDEKDHNEKKDGTPTPQWSTVLMKEYMKTLQTRRKDMDKVKALTEQVVLEKMLAHVVQKQQQAKEENSVQKKESKPPAAENAATNSLEIKYGPPETTDTLATNETNDNSGPPSPVAIQLKRERNTATAAKIDPARFKAIKLRAGDVIRYDLVNLRVTEQNQGEGRIVSVHPGQDLAIYVQGCPTPLPRDTKISLLQRHLRGKLEPYEHSTLRLSISMFGLDASLNGKFEDETVANIGQTFLRLGQELQEQLEAFETKEEQEQTQTQEEKQEENEVDRNDKEATEAPLKSKTRTKTKQGANEAENSNEPTHVSDKKPPATKKRQSKKKQDTDETDRIDNQSTEEQTKTTDEKLPATKRQRTQKKQDASEQPTEPTPAGVESKADSLSEENEANTSNKSALKKRKSVAPKKESSAQKANGEKGAPQKKKKQQKVIIEHDRIPARTDLEALKTALQKTRRKSNVNSMRIRMGHLQILPSIWSAVLTIARSQEDYTQNLDLLLEKLAQQSFKTSLEPLWQYLDGNKDGSLSDDQLEQMTTQWKAWMLNNDDHTGVKET